jgi:hypothetical protein
MNIGSPFRVKRMDFDPQVHGVQFAASELPTYEAWKAMTDIVLVSRSSDPILSLIDEYLKTYHNSQPQSIERLACLNQLYFLTDYWLKEAGGSKDGVVTRREPAMWGLFKVVVNCMCQVYQCAVNVLPRVLEETWGRHLTPHGRKVDRPVKKGGAPEVAIYLNEMQREKYRLRFKAGLAYQLPWWSWWRVKPVLAESKRVGWTYAPQINEQMMAPGYAGFALTMGREIYMAHHRGGFFVNNFFHSSYASGGAVLCTGTMLIEHGVVTGLCNDSGHYQPTIAHLVNVVQTLQMHGQQPAQIQVTAVKYSWYDDQGKPATTDWTGTGQDLLDWANGKAGLEYLRWAGDQQIGAARTKFNKTVAANFPKPPPPKKI